MSEQLTFPLAPPPTSDVVAINARCSIHVEDEQRVVVVGGLAVHVYCASDLVATAYAMVFLANAGFATQVEIARAFACDERTVRRHQQRYADTGMTGLASRVGWRAGRRRLPSRRLRTITRLKAEGRSNYDIARRLGVTEGAIRHLVGPATVPPQSLLPLPDVPTAIGTDAASTPTPAATVAHAAPAPPMPPTDADSDSSPDDDPRLPLCLDDNAYNRTWDRMLASCGLLDDAAPVFANATAVPRAGVLVALPALCASGIFRLAHKLYAEIGPAFYGLRTTLVVLLLMALWRLKRPEALKEHDPAALGHVLGLDRVPEVKTIRRKLTALAAQHQATHLGEELARLRVAERGQLMGFLYVDGHVRAYHGHRTIPKTHVARMRIAMPATTDYWVNDGSGDPLFVLTAEANAGLVKTLPTVLTQVRSLVGPRRVTIVFDRGGWSPKLFAQLGADGFDILTYRKGKTRHINARRFVATEATLDGRKVAYQLHDQPVRFLKGKLRLRQVTRLSADGHQTQVITSRQDLSAIEVAYRMFERWRQENFFKYMREEFLIDALVDYKVEPDDPTRTVPNPQRRVLDKKIAGARAEVARLEQAYGAAAIDNAETHRPTMRGFKIAHGRIGQPLRTARERLAVLVTQRRALPVRVAVRDLSETAVIKLAAERKHLTTLVRMVAYQAESDLLGLLQPHYARADDEGRTLLHELFNTAADLRLSDTELGVTLAPLSVPHRTLAARALCAMLNDSATVFPGTRLTLRFAVQDPPSTGLAFPGPRPRPAAVAPPPP